MKKVNDHPFLLAEDFLAKKSIKDIEPGDLLLIGNPSMDSLERPYVKYLKLIIIPEQEVNLTKNGNLLAEGYDSLKIAIRWLPRHTYKFLFRSIKLGSFTEDGYIVYCSKSTQMNHLFEPYNGEVTVIAKKEEFVEFFKLEI